MLVREETRLTQLDAIKEPIAPDRRRLNLRLLLFTVVLNDERPEGHIQELTRHAAL